MLRNGGENVEQGFKKSRSAPEFCSLEEAGTTAPKHR